MIKRALISVSDKTGIVDCAKRLDALGIEIISTGGTHAAIVEAGVRAREVSDLTGFPECLDGRVKTLHPAVHAGLLARRDDPAHMATIDNLGIGVIDLVIVNLYPFLNTILKPDCTFEDAIEKIDIGGPSMLRSAAKNHRDVIVVTDPADYARVLEALETEGAVDAATKRLLCLKAFEHTAQYDATIAAYLRGQTEGADPFPDALTLTFTKAQGMRYGENPHQGAAFYKEPVPVAGSLVNAEQLHGKELSYNNIGDAEGALELLREFDGVAAVAVKHANPCGVGLGGTVLEAYTRAYEADPMSIHGGIVALSGEVDADTALLMSKILLDIVIAPSYTEEALSILKKKKNVRLLKLDTLARAPKGTRIYKKVLGGLLVQDADLELFTEGEPFKVVTKRAPTPKEVEDMMLAWRIVKHTRSNGIAIAKDSASLGIGPGQVNRIWATQAAIERSGERVRGAALASDAFFPFDDCAEAAGKAGITAIIQPGGALGDQKSIDMCDKYGIAMVFTGMRHFKH